MSTNSARYWVSAVLAAFGGFVLGGMLGGYIESSFGAFEPWMVYGLGAFSAVTVAYLAAPQWRIQFAVLAVVVVSAISWLLVGTRRKFTVGPNSSWIEQLFDYSLAGPVAGALVGGVISFIAWYVKRHMANGKRT